MNTGCRAFPCLAARLCLGATGTLDVQDWESHATWHQAAAGPTDFRVEVRLPAGARNLSLSVRLDEPKRPIGGFDFSPPFAATASSFLAVADYTDGHLYPCDLAAWLVYDLDRAGRRPPE